MSGTLRGLRGAAQVDKHPAAVPVDDLPALQTGGVYHGSTPGVIGFERAYEEDNIDPLYNSSDTELVREMEPVCSVLMNEKADWEAQKEALLTIRSLIAGGNASHPSFAAKIVPTAHRLSKLVKDLRSELVKVACLTVAELSVALQQQFEPIAEIITPSLLDAPKVSIEVIRSSAEHCMQTIIWNCPSGFGKTLPKIVLGTSSASRAVRAQAFKYLSQVCRQWPKSSLNKHVDALEAVVVAGVGDADPEARLNARTLFWSLYSHYPERIPGKLSKFDSTVEQLIRNELANVIRVASVPPHITPLNIQAQETGLDDDDDAMEEVEVNPVESNPLSFSAVGGDGREVAVSSRRSMGVAVRVPSTVSKTPRRGMRSSFGIPSSFDALMAEEVEDEDVYDTKPAEDSVKQGAVRVPVQTHPSDSALASRTAVRPATASATGLKAGAVRMAQPEPPSSTLSGNTNGGSVSASFLGGPARRIVAITERPPPAAASASGLPFTHTGPKATDSMPGMTDGDSPTSDSFNLKSVLTSCSDVDWDTRRKGCVSLKEVADDPRRLAEVRAGSEAIAKCIADRMDDRNHKVVQAGLDAAMHFLRIHPGSFKPAMDTLLFPKFMMHVHALAAATATKADELITVILSMYPHADVILWAVKTLINTAEAQTRSGTLDVMSRIAEQCLAASDVTAATATAFSSLHNGPRLKQVLALVAKAFTQKKLQVYVRTIVKALTLWDNSMLTSTLSTCSSETQSTFASVLTVSPPGAAVKPKVTVGAVGKPSVASAPSPAASQTLPSPASTVSTATDGDSVDAAPVGIPSPTAPLPRLRTTVDQLCRASASVQEQSACLRVIAHILQANVSPVTPAADDASTCIPPLIHKLCDTLVTGNTPLRVLTCTVLRRLTRKYSDVIAVELISKLLSCCLSALDSCSREEFHVVEWSVAEIVKGLPVPVVIECVGGLFEELQLGGLKASASQIQFAIRVLTFAIGVCRDLPEYPAQLAVHIDASIMPALLKAFRHPSADVRKSVVFALVDLVGCYGLPFQSKLEEGLDLAQRKLVGIYLKKAAEAPVMPYGAGKEAQPSKRSVVGTSSALYTATTL